MRKSKLMELKVRSKIGIVAVILVVIGITGMLAFIYSVESTRADRILDATEELQNVYRYVKVP